MYDPHHWYIYSHGSKRLKFISQYFIPPHYSNSYSDTYFTSLTRIRKENSRVTNRMRINVVSCLCHSPCSIIKSSIITSASPVKKWYFIVGARCMRRNNFRGYGTFGQYGRKGAGCSQRSIRGQWCARKVIQTDSVLVKIHYSDLRILFPVR